MLKVRDFLASAAATLSSGAQDTSEAEAVAVRLCEEVLGVKGWQWVLEPSMEVPASVEPRLWESLRRLSSGEPLQYVLGYADFCGFRFNVSPSVLIPRPETEELCRLVVRETEGGFGVCPQDVESSVRSGKYAGLRIVDLCTGSGCLAWSLALLLPGAEVFGVDVSEEALSVARSQPLPDEVARRGAVVPKFMRADVLSDSFLGSASENGDSSFSVTALRLGGDFDVVVSNPPYVRLSEKPALPENVKNYEPELALFVPDDDPLLFYRAIAKFSVKRLRIGGFGFVEINEALEAPTVAIFSSAGFSFVKSLRDFRAKFRFIAFKK